MSRESAVQLLSINSTANLLIRNSSVIQKNVKHILSMWKICIKILTSFILMKGLFSLQCLRRAKTPTESDFQFWFEFSFRFACNDNGSSVLVIVHGCYIYIFWYIDIANSTEFVWFMDLKHDFHESLMIKGKPLYNK